MSTVLVVDDDPKFQTSVRTILENAGYNVIGAGDGDEAIRMLEAYRREIDLAIIDLSLPGVNGFEIIGALSRRPNSVKIIATTGVYRESQLEVAGTLGAHAVIRKPPEGRDLPVKEWLGTVRQLVGTPADSKRARASSASGREKDSPSSSHGNKNE